MTRRSERRVFILLGSNIDPVRNVPEAVRRLHDVVQVERVSRVYESAPVGGAPQPAFLNAAVLARTAASPARLKHDVLRPMEARMGRVRTRDRFAPRTIDLDIALYGDLVQRSPEGSVVLPDPDIERFPHVALPLADLDPRFVHPVTGRTLEEIAAAVSRRADVRVVSLELRQEAA